MKLLLDAIGLGFQRLTKQWKKDSDTPIRRSKDHYAEVAKDQFEELKKKGLSIPIFTL